MEFLNWVTKLAFFLLKNEMGQKDFFSILKTDIASGLHKLGIILGNKVHKVLA
jgi:hypothetical protein